MKTHRSQLLRAALHTLAISATPSLVLAQDVISLNFTDSEAGSTITQGSPGAIPIPFGNWTNANSVNGDGSLTGLINQDGTPTTAAIEWVSANTWRSGNTPTSGNGQLTKGYLDDGSGGSLITVSNIPYLLWNAYAIVGTDQGGGTQNTSSSYRPVTVNGLPFTWDGTATIQGGTNWLGQNWTNADTLTEGLNYLRIASQGGQTAVIRGGTNSGGRGPIAGIQIEDAYTGNFTYWDLNGAAAGAGGPSPNGTWDAAATNWSPSSEGTQPTTAWAGAGNAAVFSAGSDASGSFTVTLNGTRTADAVILEEGDLTLSGGELNLVSPSILRAGGGGLTVSSTLSGTQGLVMEGTSSVSISGTHNISGGAVVTVPALNLASGSSLPNLGGLAVGSGVTFLADTSSVTTAAGMSFGQGSSLLLSSSTFLSGGDIAAAGTAITASGTTSVQAASLFANLGTSASSVTVNGTSTVTLDGDGLGGQGQFQQNSGAVDLADNAVVTADRYVNRGNGLAHTLNISSNATLNVSDDLIFGDNANAPITITQTGGSVTNTGTTNNPGGNDMSNRWGHWGGGNTIYNLSAGSLNLTGAPLYLSWDGPATLNITGTGLANIAGFNMGFGARVNASAINLESGRLNVGSFGIVSGGATGKTINLGAGTLGALGSWSSPLPMNITAAHTVDTGGFDIALNGALSGPGSITKTGDGVLALTGANTFTGPVTVNQGGVRIGGTTNGGLTLAPGTRIGAGNQDLTGFGTVDTVNLAAGAGLLIRLGEFPDTLEVTTPGGLVTAGSNPIDLAGGFGLEPGTYTIIDYETSIGGAGYSAFTLGSKPHITASLSHNIAQTSVELIVTGVDTLRWTGGSGSDWDLDTTANWFLINGMTGAPFFQSDSVVFDDSAATGTVNIIGDISPGDIAVDNDSLDYVFTGAGIGGTTGLLKTGTGKLTLLNDNTFTGPFIVREGVVQVGDGSSGSILTSTTVEIEPDGEFVFVPAANGNFSNPILNQGTFRLGGTSNIALTGPLLAPSDGSIVIDSTGTTTFSTAQADWSGNLTVNNGTVFTTGFAIASLGVGSDFRTLTFNSGTTLSMGQNNIFGGGATPATNIPLLVFNDATLTSSRYNVLGDLTLNGSTVTGAPTDGPGAYEGYEFRGKITVVGSSPSLIENTNGRHNHLDVSTEFEVADVTGNADADLLITAPFQNASPDNGSIISGMLKTGPGTLQLTAPSTYTGPTDVLEGVLALTGGASLASSLIEVGPGAILDLTATTTTTVLGAGQGVGGDGTVNGDLDLAGTIAPGAFTGELTLTDNLAMLGGSGYAWEVADWNAGGTPGTDFDTFTAATIDIQANNTAPITITVLPDGVTGFTEADRSFVIATATTSLTGFSGSAFVIDASAFATETGATGIWSVQQSGNTLLLNYTTGGDPFLAWATVTHNLSGTNALPGSDPDLDGTANVIEFVIGGDPTNPADLNLLPTGIIDGTEFVVTYRLTTDSAYLNPFIEYGSDLLGWTTATNGVAGVSIVETPDGFGTGVTRVDVRIPRTLATSGKLFTRLNVPVAGE